MHILAGLSQLTKTSTKMQMKMENNTVFCNMCTWKIYFKCEVFLQIFDFIMIG